MTEHWVIPFISLVLDYIEEGDREGVEEIKTIFKFYGTGEGGLGLGLSLARGLGVIAWGRLIKDPFATYLNVF